MLPLASCFSTPMVTSTTCTETLPCVICPVILEFKLFFKRLIIYKTYTKCYLIHIYCFFYGSLYEAVTVKFV
jgi:hypothetical protein